MNWANLPLWTFCWVEPDRVIIKVQAAVESPVVQRKVRDGRLTAETLLSSANKLCGYRLKFSPHKDKPNLLQEGYSLVVTYGVVPDDDTELRVVLASPHLRVLRAGPTRQATYHVVIRKKEKELNASPQI